MLLTLIEILKIMGLIILILLAAGVIMVIIACIIFVFREFGKTWKNGAGKKE